MVSREAPPNTTVSLNSQRLPEKLPEVTGTSRGNPEFPEVTRERLGEGMKKLSQSGNNAQVWIYLVMKVKVQCYKEQYCIGTWNIRSMNQSKLEVVKQRWKE